MAVDISDQPLAQRSRSKISLGRSWFEIGNRPFSCVAGSSPLLGLSSIIFAIVFSGKPKGHISLFLAKAVTRE